MIYKHTGIDARNTFDGFCLRRKGTFRTISNRHSYRKAPRLTFGGIWEIEVILAIFFHTIRCPHGIGLRITPRHTFLRKDDTMVGPVGKILGGEHMVVSHAEPLLESFVSIRSIDIVGWVDIHLIIKYACGRVCRELVADDRVLCRKHERHAQKNSGYGLFHFLLVRNTLQR